MRSLIKLFLPIIALFMVAVGAQSCSSDARDGVVTISSLLEEMIDRDAIAQFPTVAYQCKQASSYNRESVSPDEPGWFADSDGVYCIRTEENQGATEWVLMEDDGPGAITKIWAVCFYYGLNDTTGANIKIYLDGDPEPVIFTNFFDLVRGRDFVKAPFADESTRAGNLYFPIPYAKSCKITMDKKAFYNIINYRKYPVGTDVKTFTMADFEAAADLRAEVANILTTTPDAEGDKVVAKGAISKGESVKLELPKESKAVKQLEIKIAPKGDYGEALRSVVLIGKFDDKTTVWTPVGDFFNNVGKKQEYSMWERTVEADGTMICRWAMPYSATGEISLENFGSDAVEVSIEATVERWSWDDNSMHFYSSWRMDEPTPTFPLFDWNFLDAQGQGVVVGDEWTVLNPREGWWGEGDEKIYIDDDIENRFPSHFGTGTEDYYGWAGGVVPTSADQFSKPFLGNIIVADPRSKGYNVCTRTRVLDAIPFQRAIEFDIESSCGTRQRWHYLQYSQTTFWYGKPGVKYNRKPLPEMLKEPLPTLEWLESVVEEAKKQQYVVDGALEAEMLPVLSKSEGVEDNLFEIPMWGELSGDKMTNFWFKESGDFVEFKITEQFEVSEIEICAAVGRNNGVYNIYINGVKKLTQNLSSNHHGVTTPLIKLTDCQPVDNAFVVKFEYAGGSDISSPREGYLALGVDYFLIKNNFLERK